MGVNQQQLKMSEMISFSLISIVLSLLISFSSGMPSQKMNEEDLRTLMKRFMFENYDFNDYEYEQVEIASVAPKQAPVPAISQPKSVVKKEKNSVEEKKTLKVIKKKEVEIEEPQKVTVEPTAQNNKTQEKVESPKNLKVNPQLKEFTLIISKLLFHLSQL